jgi:phenylalanyl-tRNA synthetase beta chain
MPTIDVEAFELKRLLKLDFEENLEKLDEALALVKSEVKAFDRENGTLSIEIKDTNRPDLWSVEGLARGLQGYLKHKHGLAEYTLGEANVEVNVDDRLDEIRPYIGCAVVKNVELTDSVIRGLMHLQDKLDQTYGRSRQRTSIGLYDFTLITPPLDYTVSNPHETRFTPLGFTETMSLAEILKRHPKGVEYGHIVKKHKVYPILKDAKGKVLSFPPIINSNDLGQVTEKTRHVLVEVTGTMLEPVLNTLKLVTLALIDRGGKAYAAKINYPHRHMQMHTPDLSTRTIDLNVDYANRLLGLTLDSERIASLLQTAGFGAQPTSASIVSVRIPCYRIDIMHPVDLVEDVAIAYGYNNIKPLWRELPTTGGQKPEQRFLNATRELMVGLGYQEILSYTLTNPENLFAKMNLPEQTRIEIANPKVVTMTCLRSWLLPGLMEFLSNNKSSEYPQKIFEQGKITLPDENAETQTRDEEWLAAATSHAASNFNEAKSALNALLLNLGVQGQTKPISHPSFIEGRAGAIIVNKQVVGVVGEIHPQVLVNWNLENPTAAFEVNLQKIMTIKAQKNN